MELTDGQWATIKPLIPTPRRRKDGRGRPWRNPREVLGGILWVLRTGARWRDLPDRYPPYQTCHRRFQLWCRAKIMAIADRSGLPVAVGIGSASPHEVTLVEGTIDNGFLADAPEPLIGDRAYDSDGLDQRLLEERGIELIARHRRNRRRTG